VPGNKRNNRKKIQAAKRVEAKRQADLLKKRTWSNEPKRFGSAAHGAVQMAVLLAMAGNSKEPTK
jgi:hypothetical protein